MASGTRRFSFDDTLGRWTTQLLEGDVWVSISDQTYVHLQDAASNTWTVVHNLAKRPSVSVVDSAGNVVYGDVTYIDDNSLVVTFMAPFGGRVYCN